MKKALLVVDYQYDFVADDGKLTAGKFAQDIEDRIVASIEEYKNKSYEGVFFTYDTHFLSDFTEKNHPEGSLFEPHCIENEKGYELYGKLQKYENLEDSKAVFFKKRGYSIKHEDIELLFKEYDEFTVIGLVTDICVFHNVIAIYNYACNHEKKIKITVDMNACASFNQEREAICVDYMRDVLGVNVI